MISRHDFTPEHDHHEQPCTVELEGCLDMGERCLELAQKVAKFRPMPEQTQNFEKVRRTATEHLRHTLDHYSCLLTGLERDVIDYDARDRDSRLEEDIHALMEAFQTALTRMQALRSMARNTPVSVRQASHRIETTAPLRSSLARELSFLSAHTVHHIAMIALMCEAIGLKIDRRLYLAFSTEHYEKAKAFEQSREQSHETQQ